MVRPTKTKVVETSSEVIEKKLLAVLDGGPNVAVVLSSEALDDLIAAVNRWPTRDRRGARLAKLYEGLSQLRLEAFGTGD